MAGVGGGYSRSDIVHPPTVSLELQMRIAVGILATASVLFAFGAAGLLGTWSLGAATILGLIGAIWTVTVMEEREYSGAIVATLADRRRPTVADSAGEPAELLTSA